ncbi:MAG: cation:proton antiporter [Thermoplasmata archaeon]|nr:cation:proton antiporter [Thermoplasmata archaeon]
MLSLSPTGEIDLDLVAIFGTLVATALIARATHLPITALEIVAGITLVTLLAFQLPLATDGILVLGGLFIVFLAGMETNLGFLRAHFRKAFTIGLVGFLVPFLGLFAVLYYGVHAPLIISIIGATALADTSISIVYTTLQQYELTDLPFGRLVLAGTLAVNLIEDFSITTTTFLTTPGLVFTIAVLGALAVAALALPSLARRVNARAGKGSFANVPARTLLFSLAILAFLSTLVGVPGILFVFLMGLIFSEWAGRGFLKDIRNLAFAIFIPLYFLAVGLKVDLAYVVAHWPLLVAVVVVATALKIGSILPVARRLFGNSRAGPVTVLMNARLTSATVILTLTLGLGILPVGWYSLFISVVVLLAIGSAASLRAFPGFKTVASARALFAGGDLRDGVGPVRLPTVVSTESRGAPP